MENVAKNKGKPALNEDLAALIEAQDDKAGIWMAIPNPGKSKVFPMLWMDKVGESLADVKWFSMKLIITDEIEFTRTYGMKDKESAEKLAVALSKDFKETRNRLESIWSFRGMGFNMRKVTNVKEAANMREVAEEVANTQKIDVKDSEVVTSMKILSVSLDKLYASDKDGGKEKPTNK